jgi:hypothetical protein
MALLNLKDIYKDKGREFIENLFTKYVIVSEQVDGSRITINRDKNNCLCYCKKDGTLINFIDRTMMVFYETAFSHFESMPMETILKFPDNWIFGFQYFPSTAPSNIVYDRTPLNGLILTDIQIINQDGRTIKVISDTRVLSDWANTLGVEKPPVIFNGFLNSSQKGKILEYLSAPESDLKEIFKSQSFTRYIISILNPDLRTTVLMNDVDKPVEGIIFKFITPGSNDVYAARLIDPIFREHARTVKEPIRRSSDIYQIALLDIIEFMEMYKLDQVTLSSETPDNRYIELICQIFNDYIKENGHKYIGVDFETPDFAKKPEFELNLSTIPNIRTQEILKNEKLKDLFKIILSSFRKYRKTITPILTQNIVDLLNSIILEIQKKVEMLPDKDQVLDFNSYLKRDNIEGLSSIFESVINGDPLEDKHSVLSFHEFINKTTVTEKKQLVNKEKTSLKKNTEEAKNKIINSEWGQKYNFKIQTEWRRLGNLDKINKDQFLEIIKDLFDDPVVKIYEPREGPNNSSKFNMYFFETETGPVEIILSGGGGEGEKYEQLLVDKLKSAAGLEINDIEDSDIKKIFTELKINPINLTPDDIEATGNKDKWRNISFEGPENVGSKIADITIKPDYYLSIKNIEGGYFYNGGKIPFIVEKNGEIIYDETLHDKKPIISELFDSLKIDAARIAKGLNDYKNKQGDPDKLEEIKDFDSEKMLNFLASGLGYGYWYIREKTNDIFIKNIDSAETARRFIGNITNISIKYPSIKTKALSLKIECDNLNIGKVEYLMEMRNTHGEILPLELKIKIN